MFKAVARVKNKGEKKNPRCLAALAGVALLSTAIVSSSVAANGSFVVS